MQKRIRMRTSIAGERWSARKGSEVSIDAAEADRLIAAGYAELVEGEIETASVAAPERAVKPRGKPRRG